MGMGAFQLEQKRRGADRALEVWRRRLAGESAQAIAATLGITDRRVYYLIVRAKKLAK